MKTLHRVWLSYSPSTESVRAQLGLMTLRSPLQGSSSLGTSSSNSKPYARFSFRPKRYGLGRRRWSSLLMRPSHKNEMSTPRSLTFPLRVVDCWSSLEIKLPLQFSSAVRSKENLKGHTHVITFYPLLSMWHFLFPVSSDWSHLPRSVTSWLQEFRFAHHHMTHIQVSWSVLL